MASQNCAGLLAIPCCPGGHALRTFSWPVKWLSRSVLILRSQRAQAGCERLTTLGEPIHCPNHMSCISILKHASTASIVRALCIDTHD